MADYPTTSQSDKTTLTPFSSPATDIIPVDNGTPRLVVKGDATVFYFNIKLVHEFLTTSERNSFLSHYQSNFDISFNMTYQGDSGIYICFYSTAPKFNWTRGNWWMVENNLVGQRT